MQVIFWAIAVGAYFFQFPFFGLSKLIIPFLGLYIVFQLPHLKIIKEKKYIIPIAIYFILIAALICRSFFLGIAFSRIVRFSVILVIIPITCLVKDDNFDIKKDIFIYLAIIKSVIIIFFGLMVAYQGSYVHFREWTGSFDMGDIYFFNRFLPKVQVRGNALLVIAFFVDYISNKKFTAKNIIILLGVLVAGNFAFMLALVAFALWQGGIYAMKFIRTNKYGKKIVIAAGIVCLIVLIPYFIVKIQEKSTVSNAVRIDQIKILLDANPLFGDGLGCWVKATAGQIKYNGDMYFEMQTLYIYKQIGIFALALYYVVTLMPMKRAGKNSFIIYLIYLFFSFWNPYCFDATQIIAILLIINTPNLGEHNEKSDSYSLSSVKDSQG